MYCLLVGDGFLTFCFGGCAVLWWFVGVLGVLGCVVLGILDGYWCNVCYIIDTVVVYWLGGKEWVFEVVYFQFGGLIVM